MLRYGRLAVVIMAALVLAGCGGGTSSGDGGPKKFRIAVVPKGTSHDFWYSVRAGAQRADAEFDDIQITWKGPKSEGDTNDQIKIVEDFVADGYDGICLAPADAIALRRPVEFAIQNKIPVLIFDSGLAELEGTVSYVATNNYRGGRRAGEYLAKLLDGKGKVILMRYQVGSESTAQREQGFLDAMYLVDGIEIISADKYAGPDERGAIELAENLLSNFGDEVDGIFCPNQSTASGMLTVLGRDPRGLIDKVKFVGFDSGENIAAAIVDGRMDGTILQDPVQMGYEAVRLMREHLIGRPVDLMVEVPEFLATPENANEPEIRRLLYPEAAD